MKEIKDIDALKALVGFKLTGVENCVERWRLQFEGEPNDIVINDNPVLFIKK